MGCLCLFIFRIKINDKKYTVTNDILRVNQDNNSSEYLWPIDFTELSSGVRMQYRLQSSGISNNIAGTPYMQNFLEAIRLDEAHLKFTINNGTSNEYYDQNFQARKLVLKLSNYTSALRYSFSEYMAFPFHGYSVQLLVRTPLPFWKIEYCLFLNQYPYFYRMKAKNTPTV